MNASAPVPADLQQLADQYEAKKAAGTAKKHGSGFGGHGFQFNEEEARKKKECAILHAKLFGGDLAEGIEQEEELRDFDEEEESGPPSRAPSAAPPASAEAEVGVNAAQEKRAAEVAARVAAADAAMGDVSVDVRFECALFPSSITVTRQNSDKLFFVFEPQQLDATAKARLFAQQIQQKAQLKRKALQNLVAPVEPTHFEGQIEINDYPQNVRWKVTHKDALAGVTELTNCSMTVKGVFVAPGKQPPPGEKPLFLLIEGPTQQDVDLAKIEIRKIIHEAIQHMPALEKMSGRYQVV